MRFDREHNELSRNSAQELPGRVPCDSSISDEFQAETLPAKRGGSTDAGKDQVRFLESCRGHGFPQFASWNAGGILHIKFDKVNEKTQAVLNEGVMGQLRRKRTCTGVRRRKSALV